MALPFSITPRHLINPLLALSCLALAALLWRKNLPTPPELPNSRTSELPSFVPISPASHCKSAMRVVEDPSHYRVVVAARDLPPASVKVDLQGSLLTIYTFAANSTPPSPGELPLACSAIMLPGPAKSASPRVLVTNDLLFITVPKP